MTYKEIIKAKIERLREEFRIIYAASHSRETILENQAKAALCKQLLSYIDSVQEEPKFKVGDKLVSTKNPHLTYNVLEVGNINELGNIEYKVEIFCDDKAGIQVGNTFKEHNVHMMECKKVDEWAKLIEESVSEDLKEEIERYLKESLAVKFPTTNIESIKADIRYIARHFANWQKQQMMKDAVDGEVTYGKSLAIPSLGYRLDKEGLDFGDKVKLIIIKEDRV